MREFKLKVISLKWRWKMPVVIKEIVYEYAKDIQQLLGKDLSKIVMYGSYVRGDFTDNSDIDLMILVDVPEEENRILAEKVSDRAFDYLIKYGIYISPVVKNEGHFKYWVDNLPYYRNVRDEGVIIDAG